MRRFILMGHRHLEIAAPCCATYASRRTKPRSPRRAPFHRRIHPPSPIAHFGYPTTSSRMGAVRKSVFPKERTRAKRSLRFIPITERNPTRLSNLAHILFLHESEIEIQRIETRHTASVAEKVRLRPPPHPRPFNSTCSLCCLISSDTVSHGHSEFGGLRSISIPHILQIIDVITSRIPFRAFQYADP